MRVLYVKDPPPPERLGEYYENASGNEMRSRPNALFAALRKHRLMTDLRPLLERAGSKAPVLDFGTGDGSVAMLLAQRQYPVAALDLFPESDWAHPEIPYRCYSPGELGPEDLRVGGHPPRAVVMRHVLEHVPAPAALLGVLREAGAKYVLVIVPNPDTRLARRLGKDWYFWDPPRHLTFFTRHALDRIASRSGFTVALHRTYGLDELATSAHRSLLLRCGTAGQERRARRLASLLRPTGFAAGGCRCSPRRSRAPFVSPFSPRTRTDPALWRDCLG